MESINPKNGEKIKEYGEIASSELGSWAEKSAAAFQDWKKVSLEERCHLLSNASDVLEKKKNDLAKLITDEMGKPISESRSEIEKCAWVCRYYSENAPEFLKDKVVDTDFDKSYVTYRPLGPVLAVMPWNFPFWQVFRFAAPNLALGNTGILKHASNVSGCSLAIQDVFESAGFPKNTFLSLLVDSSSVDKLIEHPEVKAVTLTGSNGAGKSVAETAGKYLKKTVLELGGSDAYVVLQDADVSLAAKKCAKSRMINTGQSCIAAKRFIIHTDVYKEFTQLLVKEFESLKVGDPLDEDVDVGPLARKDLRKTLRKQMRKSVEAGAKVIFEMKTQENEGWYFPPTILGNVKPGMPAFDEELFGPMASLIEVTSEEEAIQLANKSQFGLGGAVFSTNIKRAEEIAAKEMECGSCFVNDFVKSDPRLPFGGVKESGHGRELSLIGIHEFANIKTICVNK